MGVSNGWDEGSEAWDGLQREQDEPMGESEAWEGSTDGGESFTDRQDGWGGFPGESEG
jgi:hypothetical protein